MVRKCSKRWSGKWRAKLLVSPLLEWHVDIGDSSTECGGILRRHGMHVLRPWPGQFVDLSDVTGRTGQNGRNNLSHIPGVDGRRFPGTERQPDGGVPDNRFGGPVQEEGVLEEGRGSDVDHGQPGPVQHLLPEPMLPLLRGVCHLGQAHLRHGHLRDVDQHLQVIALARQRRW